VAKTLAEMEATAAAEDSEPIGSEIQRIAGAQP
jgi:hypothetical protein